MGKNYFQAIPIRTAYQKKLEKFTSSLGKAIGKGEPIPFAGNDLTYTLNLQNERIKEKGIEFDYEVFRRIRDDTRFFEIANWKDMHYATTVGFGVAGINRQVRKDGKVIYKDKLRNDFFGLVCDIVSGGHADNESHICPNCGAESTIAELQDGCPYCGTQYKMDDLLPKITGFYFFDSLGATKKQILLGWAVCAVFCAILFYVLYPYLLEIPMLSQELSIVMERGVIGEFIFGIMLGAAYGFFLFWFLHLLFKIASAIVDLWRMGTAASRNRFELRMRKLSPEFSFEYFKGKALSLIKMAVYAKDENESPSYKGEPLSDKFKDIIDLNYAGTFGLKRFSEEDGIVTVETKSYFDVLSIKGDKVKFTHPVIKATFQRRTDIPVNLNFSMTRISCPTCGMSFNAMKNKFCPGCGNEYELLSDDWVLTELSMESK